MKQKAFILITDAHGDGRNNLDELQEFLDDGWKVSMSCAMGGAGGGETRYKQYRSLVILECD